MSSTGDLFRLPCGRDANTLWDHVTAGHLDAHEQSCPHCRAAVPGFRALAGATSALARLDATPPPRLTEQIMRAVRAEARRGAELPVTSTTLGPIRITAQAAAVVLRFAADQCDGVVARSCTITPAENGYDVRLAIAVRYGTAAPAAAEHVRRLVRAAGRDLIGFAVNHVDVDVADLLEQQP
jgi:uncharacterized alkaline shock family protein YloU